MCRDPLSALITMDDLVPLLPDMVIKVRERVRERQRELPEDKSDGGQSRYNKKSGVEVRSSPTTKMSESEYNDDDDDDNDDDDDDMSYLC
eukprot:gnl/Chilomastix_caulleri/1831.p2 GENE.gnl/Chilomastix_caulleri/1831~~gnl/Chilomastix_caulleri/1831.p2  ORF type:complete len:90 (+),score=13.88 gnl/Chilomastix_caulleri/1831:477-746(+)